MFACDCGSRTFLYEWKSKSWKTTVWDSNDGNKTEMEFLLSRDLFNLGFLGASAEFLLDFGRC